MATSIKRKIVEQVQSDIQAIGLSGIASENIVIVEGAELNDQPDEQSITEILGALPGVVIMSVEAETIDELGASPVGKDDIGYPVLIGLFAAKTEDITTSDDVQALWREQIRQTFIRQRLSTIAHTCTVEPKGAVNSAWRRKFLTWASMMVLRFHVREARL